MPLFCILNTYYTFPARKHDFLNPNHDSSNPHAISVAKSGHRLQKALHIPDYWGVFSPPDEGGDNKAATIPNDIHLYEEGANFLDFSLLPCLIFDLGLGFLIWFLAARNSLTDIVGLMIFCFSWGFMVTAVVLGGVCWGLGVERRRGYVIEGVERDEEKGEIEAEAERGE